MQGSLYEKDKPGPRRTVCLKPFIRLVCFVQVAKPILQSPDYFICKTSVKPFSQVHVPVYLQGLWGIVHPVYDNAVNKASPCLCVNRESFHEGCIAVPAAM